MLEDLYSQGGLDELDLFLRNSQRQSAVDLAAVMQAQEEEENDMEVEEDDSTVSNEIWQLIRAQVHLWRKDVRPALLHLLSEPLIPDLAQLALSYVDGSGAPFDEAANVGNAEEE